MATYLDGRDWDCAEDLDPNGIESTGVRDVTNSIVRRILTRRGTLIDDPDYGTDVREWLHADVTPSLLLQIRAGLAFEIKKEQRVLDVTVQVTSPAFRTLQIAIVYRTTDGEQSLTLIVNDVTHKLLREARFN